MYRTSGARPDRVVEMEKLKIRELEPVGIEKACQLFQGHAPPYTDGHKE
jgi:hypothetical protein